LEQRITRGDRDHLPDRGTSAEDRSRVLVAKEEKGREALCGSGRRALFPLPSERIRLPGQLVAEARGDLVEPGLLRLAFLVEGAANPEQPVILALG
jgi:hypothetical protein